MSEEKKLTSQEILKQEAEGKSHIDSYSKMGWKKYSKEELENLIIKNPLKKRDVDYIFNELIGTISITSGNGKGFVYPTSEKFNFILGTNNFENRIEDDTLIHEVLHIHYMVDNKYNNLIKKETQRIIRKDSKLCRYIRENYRKIIIRRLKEHVRNIQENLKFI